MSGKTISKWAVALAIVFSVVIFIGTILITKKIPTPQETTSILMVSGLILICGSPIYISIWIDKIIGAFNRNSGGTADAVGDDIPHDPDAGDDDPEYPQEMPQKQITEMRVGFKK